MLVPDADDADAVVINTCAFIDPAKAESTETILEHAARKRDGQQLIVAGCLSQRFGDELQALIPEIDGVIGTGAYASIVELLDDARAGRKPVRLGFEAEPEHDFLPRLITTPSATAYLKIAEGCDHPCTFCIIPQLRGAFRSRSAESILAEARALAAGGGKELILIAQDTSMWGRDRGYRRGGLAELLHQLHDVDGIEWIRLLYLYPATVDARTDRRDGGAAESMHVHGHAAAARERAGAARDAAAVATASATSRSSTTSGAASPASRCARRSSSGSPARPTSTSRSSKRGSSAPNSTASASSPTRARTERRAPSWPARFPSARSGGGCCGCATRSAGRRSARARDALGETVRVLVEERRTLREHRSDRGRAARAQRDRRAVRWAKRPASTARSRSPATRRSGRSSTCGSTATRRSTSTARWSRRGARVSKHLIADPPPPPPGERPAPPAAEPPPGGPRWNWRRIFAYVIGALLIVAGGRVRRRRVPHGARSRHVPAQLEPHGADLRPAARGGIRARTASTCCVLGIDYNYDSKGMPYSKGARSDTIMVAGLDLAIR